MTYEAQAHFNNYNPSSFGWSRNVDLVPLSFNGVNFGHCARAVHPVFIAVLTELVPHIQGGLHAGSCWAYSSTDDLPDGSWSFHHFGIGMDINWNVNKMGNNIPDATGKYALPRTITSAIAKKYGCEWGGNWRDGFHDNMHIECHLSPAVARTVKLITPPHVPTLLEWIMSLPGAPSDLTYQKLLNDIANTTAKKTWAVDAIPAPAGTDIKANPTWGSGTFFKYLYDNVVSIKKKVGA